MTRLELLSKNDLEEWNRSDTVDIEDLVAAVQQGHWENWSFWSFFHYIFSDLEPVGLLISFLVNTFV